MDNINYILKENSQVDNVFDISVYANEMGQNESGQYYYNLEELYTSYSVKSLTQILDYYSINKYNINNKKKLVKDEIIQMLVIFETDIDNEYLVKKRRRLWDNINELQNDPFFKNFIIF
jgi:hypothetical protein